MSDKSEIEAIRARDAASADTWFKEPPLGACGRAFIDRRTLLAHVEALEARLREAQRLLNQVHYECGPDLTNAPTTSVIFKIRDYLSCPIASGNGGE